MSNTPNSKFILIIGAIAGLITAAVVLVNFFNDSSLLPSNNSEPSELVMPHVSSGTVDLGDKDTQATSTKKRPNQVTNQEVYDKAVETAGDGGFAIASNKAANVTQSQTQSAISQNTAITNIAGSWQLTSNPNTSYEFVQSGNEVTFQEISNIDGILTVTAVGNGYIGDGVMSIYYTTTSNTKFSGALRVNSNNISGQIRDQISGTAMILNLIR